MNLEALVPWVSTALAAAALLYTVITSRSKKHDERFEKIEIKAAGLAGKVDTVEDRVLKVESGLQHLPDKDAVHRLELQIGAMSNSVTALTERIRPISAMADRMQEAILEKVMSS